MMIAGLTLISVVLLMTAEPNSPAAARALVTICN